MAAPLVTSDTIVKDVEQEFARILSLNHKTGPDQLPRILNWTPEDAHECSSLAHATKWQDSKVSEVLTNRDQKLVIQYPSNSLPKMEIVQPRTSQATVRRSPAENILHMLKTGQPSDNSLLNAWAFNPHRRPEPQVHSLKERINMLQKRRPSKCTTCYCLDAREVTANPVDNTSFSLPRDGMHQVGSHEKDSWASREYNVPLGTSTRELFIKQTELATSAHGGCLFCNIISQALSVIRPGWEAQDSFIQLHMSTDLPVVVRWTKGTRIAIEPEWEESLEGVYQYDIDLRIADSSGYIEPEIEFEIYRPARSQRSSPNGALEYWVSHIGTAREAASHAGDLACFEFISDQATACLKEHHCGSRKPRLPDRVLYIEPDNSGDIRLIEPKDVRAQYIALSYCWGPTGPDTFLTDAATIAARKAGIDARDLPRLFIGVINCARMLGIAYVWIDRLCIIQGDDEDFAEQAPKMGEYYGNATLTIAAASADSEEGDILVDRDPKWRSTGIDLQVQGLGSFELRFRRRPYPIGMEARGGDYGRVSTRAWIWQERLLAARTVFFTPSALKFECHQHSVWEGFGERTTSPSWSARLDKSTHSSWLGLVEEFTHRDITRPSDRLPAISSVMKRISITHTAWTPIWGMWSQLLHKSLAWSVSSSGIHSGRHPCRVHAQYYAPSWSWASVDGPVLFGHCDPHLPEEPSFGIIDVDKETGVLTVLAHWSFALIRCRVESPCSPSDARYYYESTSVRERHEQVPPGMPSENETPVFADVALEPVKRRLSLREDGTIVRLAHGREPPRNSWESKCLCIMLGQQTRLRATVLLLGESRRVPGAYERIGLATAWPPEMFTGNARLEFKIA